MNVRTWADRHTGPVTPMPAPRRPPLEPWVDPTRVRAAALAELIARHRTEYAQLLAEHEAT